MSQSIGQSLLGEFDLEMANSRKTLERVPEDRGEFRPHPKSMTLARLAGHVSEMPMWALMTLSGDGLDLSAGGVAAVMTSRADTLARFDENLTQARERLTRCSDADMMKTWTLRRGDRVILAMPRIAVLRGFVMNHMIHHRAQLGVYLRMNDVPVPSLYGPTADEGGM
ncbi:MAG: DinB family protein [Vicinamibacterales bacterium]